MGPIGLPELILLIIVLGFGALVVVGITLFIVFLQRRDRRAGQGGAPPPPRNPE